MTQRIILLANLLAIFFLSSCTLRQEFYFNEDLSGKVRYSMDLTAFYQFMNTMPAEANESDEFSFQDSIASVFAVACDVLAQIPGITQVGQGSGDLGPYLEYQFADLDALNATMSSGMVGTGSQSDHVFFERKGRKLTFSPDLEALAEMNSEEFASMGEMFQYQLYFYFDQGLLRRVDSKMAEVAQDKTKVSMELSLNQMHESGEEMTTTFRGKFKR